MKPKKYTQENTELKQEFWWLQGYSKRNKAEVLSKAMEGQKSFVVCFIGTLSPMILKWSFFCQSVTCTLERMGMFMTRKT